MHDVDVGDHEQRRHIDQVLDAQPPEQSAVEERQCLHQTFCSILIMARTEVRHLQQKKWSLKRPLMSLQRSRGATLKGTGCYPKEELI